ncbi:hypothetical protein IJS77_04850, partial [bacterium]|nr:hypothetical protein [bacterium]
TSQIFFLLKKEKTESNHRGSPLSEKLATGNFFLGRVRRATIYPQKAGFLMLRNRTYFVIRFAKQSYDSPAPFENQTF